MQLHANRIHLDYPISPLEALQVFEHSLDVLSHRIPAYPKGASPELKDLQPGLIVYGYTELATPLIQASRGEEDVKGVYAMSFLGAVKKALCFTASLKYRPLAKKFEIDEHDEPLESPTVEGLCLWANARDQDVVMATDTLAVIIEKSLSPRATQFCMSHLGPQVAGEFPGMQMAWDHTSVHSPDCDD